MRENWRLAAAYSYSDDLGSRALAWEFLRRNSKYRSAYRAIGSEDDAASVAQRWGCAADPDLRADRVGVVWPPIVNLPQ
jgi:Family of unknown function (DUF6499)